MLKVEDVKNEQLNALKIVIGHKVDKHIKNGTLCRLDVDPTVVERSILHHVVDDFINNHKEQLSPQNTISSFPSDFQETNDIFLEFDDAFNNVGSSSVGDILDDSQPSRTLRRRQLS
ncbi:cytochrome P450 CYP82D47-like [Cucumis melo var. makuwa]|uniref:Cytochrome P450 CYP82D47-like n=1 Tax=Cucumis melo var. makuwa TaxID=1194695 RepID=A0A5D3D527_CUCMM|nr:cytochrome P450 CYP82D47-like [Cucumis melo var. makuwa]